MINFNESYFTPYVVSPSSALLNDYSSKLQVSNNIHSSETNKDTSDQDEMKTDKTISLEYLHAKYVALYELGIEDEEKVVHKELLIKKPLNTHIYMLTLQYLEVQTPLDKSLLHLSV